MSIRNGSSRSVWGLAALLAFSIGLSSLSQAETAVKSLSAETTGTQSVDSKTATQNLDLLRSIPLEVSGYASGRAFPEKFTTPEQVIQALNSTPVLLVHMEAIRRAYHDMPSTEHAKLLEAIHKRRMTNEKDLMLGFDHGYAQLVFDQNKTGLFFLRKANDFFQDQFSALAYGMAEVEADINLEGSTPEITTTRKLDATFKLGDAVKRDAMKHQPGFWPSYIQVVEKMKPLPAYKSFSRRDFSLVYVPYGDSVTSLKGVTTSNLPLSAGNPTGALTDTPLGTTCSPEPSPIDASAAAPITGASVSQQSVNLGESTALIQFFQDREPKRYHVKVTGNSGKPMAEFKAHTVPRRAAEDLDKDGVYEIVIRQYEENPALPVIVYRSTPCGLELDQAIHESFQ